MKKNAVTSSIPSTVLARSGKLSFPVVAIGGSAGAFEALQQFLSHTPTDSGAAFVLITHLDPTHKGMMPELLQHNTQMKVAQAEDGMKVEPNCVYVIPPNADMAILRGRLQLLEPHKPRGLRLPVDFFFRHLAADQQDNAVVIILSGMGSDGSLGLRDVKEKLGIVMAQDPASAKFDSMPRSAIGTGLVDYVAPVEELPVKLFEHLRYGFALQAVRSSNQAEISPAMQKIFVLLRERGGNDFSCYKQSTVDRRIERRMNVHQIDTLDRYLRFLQENPQEIDLLYRELLIGVTSFFRDPVLFEFLGGEAFREWLNERPASQPLRVWNPACSTGEEAYSLAIALNEALQYVKNRPDIQIFATDIDSEAIDKARQATYTTGIEADVVPARLARFFTREGDNYCVHKEIRGTIVFAKQNLLHDPPFTKIDLLCCRNLLIYLDLDTQKKLLPMFHYALSPGGLLVLGVSESAGSGELFQAFDKRAKVYRWQNRPRSTLLELPAQATSPKTLRHAAAPAVPVRETNLPEAAQRMLLDSYAPPAVAITPEGDIVYFNGRTGRFLEPSSGKVNVNVFAMVREGLRQPLTSAIHSAIRQRSSVTINGVTLKADEAAYTIDLMVTPFQEAVSLRELLLVVFGNAAPQPSAAHGKTAAKEARPPSAGESAQVTQLQTELSLTKEHLRSASEAMQAAQEDLRSVSEEAQSSNEELQSTNEELTSSKEEMQSLNEEMQTVNAELQAKLDELSQSSNDMKNLLNGIDVATIFLDNELRVKRFTPQATKLVNLIATDAGRPLGHLASNLRYERLVEDAKEVLDTLRFKEVAVQAHDESWYQMRMLPYRTESNRIDGVVITFTNISSLKRLEESLQLRQAELEAARDYAENIIATLREPFVVLDDAQRIISASRSFYQTFQLASPDVEGRFLSKISEQQWDIPALHSLLKEIAANGTTFNDFRVEGDFRAVGYKTFLLNARPIIREEGGSRLILLAMEEKLQSQLPPHEQGAG